MGQIKAKSKWIGKLIFKALPYVIAIATAVAALTPNKSDDVVLRVINQVADVAGLNVKHASPDTQNSGVVDLSE